MAQSKNLISKERKVGIERRDGGMVSEQKKKKKSNPVALCPASGLHGVMRAPLWPCWLQPIWPLFWAGSTHRLQFSLGDLYSHFQLHRVSIIA
jgi:hypothetical protein